MRLAPAWPMPNRAHSPWKRQPRCPSLGLAPMISDVRHKGEAEVIEKHRHFRSSRGGSWIDRYLEARHPLGGEITEQQADSEQQHQSRGTKFHAAHEQRAAAFFCAAQVPRQVLRRHRDNGNGRDRDRGAEPHHKGRGDAGPEQALSQREHQNQDGARTGPDADGEDRAQTALPAAGTGELTRSRTMGMAAMLVMDVAVIVPVVIVAMLMVVMRHMSVSLGVSMGVSM